MQSLGDVLNNIGAAKRDELLTNCANGADDALAPEERPSRAEIGPAPGCLLKFGDQVEVDGMVGLYLCPGRGVGYFYAYVIDDVSGRLQLMQFLTGSVTDRIPADPQETPMPIFSEPP